MSNNIPWHIDAPTTTHPGFDDAADAVSAVYPSNWVIPGGDGASWYQGQRLVAEGHAYDSGWQLRIRGQSSPEIPPNLPAQDAGKGDD